MKSRIIKPAAIMVFSLCLLAGIFRTANVQAADGAPNEWDDEAVKDWVAHDLDISSEEITFSPAQWEKQTVLNWGYGNYGRIESIRALTGQTDVLVLDLNSHAVTDLTPVNGMQHLLGLNLLQNPVKDLNAVPNLRYLKKLAVGWTEGQDLSGIRNFPELAEFTIQTGEKEENAVIDLSCLKECEYLDTLNIRNVSATGLESLSNLQNLTTLSMSGKGITDYSGMGDHYYLQTLELKDIETTDLSSIPFDGMRNLDKLELLFKDEETPVKVGALESLTALKTIESNGNFTDLSWLTAAYTLDKIDLEKAKVKDLSPLADFHIMGELDLPNARIEDLTPLSGKNRIRFLSIGVYGDVDLSPLAEMTRMYRLEINNYSGEELDFTPLIGKMPELSIFEMNGAVDPDSLDAFIDGRNF